MHMGRFLLICLGCDWFPLLRLRLGRYMAWLVLAAISCKHYLFFQLLPVSGPYGKLLHISAFLSLAAVTISLFDRRGRLLAGIAPGWYGGYNLLQKLGLSDRKTHLVAEPILAAIIGFMLVLPALPNMGFERPPSTMEELIQKYLPKGPPGYTQRPEPAPAKVRLEPFTPWWQSLGVAVSSRPVQWRMPEETAMLLGILLPLLPALAFALHAMCLDWPASPGYREMKRQEQMARAQQGGVMTFTSVEEIP
jgi:hypothetical protein